MASPARRRRLLALALVVGGLVGPALEPLTAAAASVNPPAFLSTWGEAGIAAGEFHTPEGVAVDASGTVYVVDQNNSRVQTFTATGAPLPSWGAFGSAPGQFDSPTGIAIDAVGDVYVADRDNHRIQKFDGSGNFVDEWGTAGSGEGEFNSPQAVAVDQQGGVYVADALNHRIQKFDTSGDFVDEWGTQGSGNGELSTPVGLAISATGRVYVVEQTNHRVQEFTTTGAFVALWGTEGSGPGQLFVPRSAAVDSSGEVYVTDGNHRVQVFSGAGQSLDIIGGPGAGPGQFDVPRGIAVSPSGDLYVADDDRIQRFVRPRPDARIRRGAAGPQVGDGIYNSTGAGQGRVGSARRGASVRYLISIQNDVATPARFQLAGGRSTRRFTVRYFAGGANITRQVVSGTYLTPTINAGTAHTVTATVTVKNRAPRRATLVRRLAVRDPSRTTQLDVVTFTTRRRR